MLWLATCAHETVDVLERELVSLGIKPQAKLYRGVLFDCDLESSYRAHLLLRTASRIQRIIAKFKVTSISMLQSELNKITWTDWLRSHKPFQVRPALTDEAAQGLSEEAVVQAIAQSIAQCEFKTHAPKFNPDADEPITIVPFIRDEVCMLGIDTAGRALHKRGWRKNGHPAVLKETLAASLLMLADYTGDEPLIDPMCGSGTIVIEAAYIALNKAPLIHRGKDDFALEHLAGFDRPLWRKVSDQLRAQKKAELKAPIYASDINAKYIEVAQASAMSARVEKYIDFKVARFQDLEPTENKGLIIMNLPYGERIGGNATDLLYREVGETLKKKFSKWRVGLLVPEGAPIHLLGERNAVTYSLLNGALPVKFIVGKL